jgi:hypothetical protein
MAVRVLEPEAVISPEVEHRYRQLINQDAELAGKATPCFVFKDHLACQVETCLCPCHTKTPLPTVQGSKELALTRIDALLTEPVPEASWVVEGLLPTAGTSGIVSRPKVGKGTTARNLALMVSRGHPFLNRKTTEGPVFYLAFEDNRERIAAHFRSMGASDEPLLVYVGGAPADGINWLTEMIWQHRPTLAILDPLGRFIKFKDVNDYAEATEKTEPLIRLAAETGCHIAWTHHAVKTDREGGEAFLGSTGLFGSVDTALLLQRELSGNRVIRSVQRYGTDLEPTVVSYDPVSGCVSVEGNRDDLELEAASRAVLRVLEGGEMDEGAIRSAEGSKLIPRALRVLVSNGQVLRQGTGRKGDPYTYRNSRSARE